MATYKIDSNLTSTQGILKQAKSISSELASSPSQNEARRRDVSALLDKAQQALNIFNNRVLPYGYAEGNLFVEVFNSIKKLMIQAPTKDLTWAQIDAELLKIATQLEKAIATWMGKVDKESLALVQSVKQKIDAFQPASLTPTEWTQIDGILAEAKAAAEKGEAFPLGQLEPWNCAKEIEKLLLDLENKIASISGPFPTKVEAITRQLSLPPQKGRKLAIWTQENKVILLMGLALILATIKFSIKKN